MGKGILVLIHVEMEFVKKVKQMMLEDVDQMQTQVV
jgi:hypothetical protein